MSLDRPLISVVVPVYNVEGFVDRCLDSICAQTYDNLDIVVVDDGSTDGSGALCDAWAVGDSRITVFHTPNRGLSAARNEGMRHVRGDYAVFVDSDDYVGMRHIENLHRVLVETGADMAATSASKATTSEERRLGLTFVPEHVEVMTSVELVDEILRPGPRNSVTSVGRLYSRKQFPQLIFPEGKAYEDLVTPVKAILSVRTVVYEDAGDYFYTSDRPESITQNPTNLPDWILEVESLRDYVSRCAPELAALAEKKYYKALVNVALSFSYAAPESQQFRDLYARVRAEAPAAFASRASVGTKAKYAARLLGMPLFRLVARREVKALQKKRPGRLPM